MPGIGQFHDHLCKGRGQALISPSPTEGRESLCEKPGNFANGTDENPLILTERSVTDTVPSREGTKAATDTWFCATTIVGSRS